MLLVILTILLTGGVWIAIGLGSVAWVALHFFQRAARYQPRHDAFETA